MSLFNSKPPITIHQGSHERWDGQACLMEWVSVFTPQEDRFTDRPVCTDDWFASFAISINDEIASDEVRSSLAPLIGRVSAVKQPAGGSAADTQMRVALGLIQEQAGVNHTASVKNADSYALFGVLSDLKHILAKKLGMPGTTSWEPLSLDLHKALLGLAQQDGKKRADRRAHAALRDLVNHVAGHRDPFKENTEKEDRSLVGLLRSALTLWEEVTGADTGAPLSEEQLKRLDNQLKELKKEKEA